MINICVIGLLSIKIVTSLDFYTYTFLLLESRTRKETCTILRQIVSNCKSLINEVLGRNHCCDRLLFNLIIITDDSSILTFFPNRKQKYMPLGPVSFNNDQCDNLRENPTWSTSKLGLCSLHS